MSWLTRFVRPKIQAIVQPKKDLPDNLWHQCRACEKLVYVKEWAVNHNVCHYCGHHGRMTPEMRFSMLFGQRYEILKIKKVPHDPLKFKDTKRYTERLKDAQAQQASSDAVQVAIGTVEGQDLVVAAFNFFFMGGSMGIAAGEALVQAAEYATAHKKPLLVIPSSGGARMQEGMFSLMQMARTTAAIQRLKDAGLPYLVLLTDPTTGGVTASFAMIGDITLAEPKAIIGFAGQRVIKETIREQLPEEFQTAEYLLDHGMVDRIVPRHRLKAELSNVLDLLMNKKKGQDQRTLSVVSAKPEKVLKSQKALALPL
jgi:acetyl-CoA carboxylase carboxyl transferase subunit beta